MAVKTCAFGHLYDTELYPSCPYCNNSQPAIDLMAEHRRTASAPRADIPVTGSLSTSAPPGYGAGGFYQQEAQRGEIPVTQTGPTQAPPGYMGGGTPLPEDRGHTKPPVDWGRGERRVTDDQATRGGIRTSSGDELIVGWLVCIQGPSKGKDYRIWGRINSIGRDSSNDICIQGDASISRRSHARLGYDPKSNRFRLVPDNNADNIYLNGEVIDAATPLHPYDVIEFGETMLVFLPLCSPRFTWKDGVIGEDGSHGAV